MRSLTVFLGCLTVATTCPAQTPNWTQLKPTTSPSPRDFQGMAFDAFLQHTVMFGGRGTSLVNDTWTWNGKNWTQLKPANSPSARYAHQMVFDLGRQRVVLFAGRQSLVLAMGDTWEWDGKNWTQMNPTTSPPARAWHMMVYDSTRQRTVLFSGTNNGRTSGVLNDTWEWDGTNWTQIPLTTSPPARAVAAMTYDSTRKRTVLFGGLSKTNGSLNDTWEYDGKRWTQITTANAPAARSYAAMAYDQARQRSVMNGGNNLTDTWEYDGNNWTRIKTTATPPARPYSPPLVYDSTRQRTVLFGARTLNDTWEYGVAKLSLTANTPTISIANGGTQALTLNAGTNLKNKSYWIFGSMTGTRPGVVLTGIHIPLVPDIYTTIALGAVNTTVFTRFMGPLSGTGTATASLNVPAKLPIPTGFKLYHAYVVFDGTTGQIFTSSNPVSVEFK